MYVTKAPVGGVLCPLPESKGKIQRSHDYPICEGMDDQFRLIPLLIPDEENLTYDDFCKRMDVCCKACAQRVREMMAADPTV